MHLFLFSRGGEDRRRQPGAIFSALGREARNAGFAASRRRRRQLAPQLHQSALNPTRSRRFAGGWRSSASAWTALLRRDLGAGAESDPGSAVIDRIALTRRTPTFPIRQASPDFAARRVKKRNLNAEN